jgi:hypothetical protein
MIKGRTDTAGKTSANALPDAFARCTESVLRGANAAVSLKEYMCTQELTRIREKAQRQHEFTQKAAHDRLDKRRAETAAGQARAAEKARATAAAAARAEAAARQAAEAKTKRTFTLAREAPSERPGSK